MESKKLDIGEEKSILKPMKTRVYKRETFICSKCKSLVNCMPNISREDGKSKICIKCYTTEALKFWDIGGNK